ncbi:MAG: LacI family transcriptional regulator [Planctomycetota bacterium]|jgi:DNA-binding LacI/PurR family transcriptional regulator|nr:LacI family transcriptional regulator [Planctomycetota bacterium]
MVTLKDVAAAAKVSTVTASSVLSGSYRVRVAEETAARINKVAKELNYVPLASAQGLKTGRTKMISFIAFPTRGKNFPAHVFETIQGIAEFTRSKGQKLLLNLTHDHTEQLETARQLAFGRQVDGIIIQSASGDDRAITGILREAKRPYVILENALPDCLSVCYDSEDIVRVLREEFIPGGGMVMVIPYGEWHPALREAEEKTKAWAATQDIPFAVWNGTGLPPVDWLVKNKQATSNGKILLTMAGEQFSSFLDIVAKSGLILGSNLRLVYMSDAESLLSPPNGVRLLRYNAYELGFRAAQLLFQTIDGKKDEAPDKNGNYAGALVPALKS